jgi:hypothetical protein
MQFPNKLTPTEILHEYMKNVVFSSNPLTAEQIEEIFLRALRDFFEKNISLKYLESIACQLNYELHKPEKISLDRELERALEEAAEITYYLRKKDKNPQPFKEALKVLKDYYKKNT